MMDIYEAIARSEGSQWDAGNVDKNWHLHRVDAREAQEVFQDPRLLVRRDDAHSQVEERYRALGRTGEGRLLFVVFTFRGSLIRVISARDMNRGERGTYGDAEEAQADS